MERLSFWQVNASITEAMWLWFRPSPSVFAPRFARERWPLPFGE